MPTATVATSSPDSPDVARTGGRALRRQPASPSVSPKKVASLSGSAGRLTSDTLASGEATRKAKTTETETPTTPRSPTPSTPPSPSALPVTPRPLAHDIASAFELASPGSSQDALANDAHSDRLEELLNAYRDSTPKTEQQQQRTGLASRMHKARGKVVRDDDYDARSSQPPESLVGLDRVRMTVQPESQPTFGVGIDERDEHAVRPSSLASSSTKRPRATTPPSSIYPSPSRISVTPDALSPLKFPTKTYGGGMRTFLEELEPQNAGSAGSSQSDYRADLAGTSTNIRPQAQRESYAELRGRWVIDDVPADDGSSPSSSSRSLPLKSLTSLRSAGALRRFMQELGYLLAGLDAAKSSKARRSTAVNLVSQLSAGFVTQLKAAHAQSKVWLALRAAAGDDGVEDDRVLSWCTAITLLYLAHKNALGDELLTRYARDVCAFLADMLDDNDEGDAKAEADRESSLTAQLQDPFHASCPLDVHGPMTSRKIALAAICALGSLPSGHGSATVHTAFVRSTRTGGISIRDAVANLLHLEAEGLKNVGEHEPDLDRLDLVVQCAEILDVHDGDGSSSKEGSIDASAAGDIIHLLEGLHRLATSPSIERMDKVPDVTSSVLRVGIARSQTSDAWTSAFAESEAAMSVLARTILAFGHMSIVQRRDDSHKRGTDDQHRLETPPSANDCACLALAFITNLLESSVSAAGCLRKVYVDEGNGHNQPAICALLDLCLAHRAAASDEEPKGAVVHAESASTSRFFAGCLAVAIALAVQSDSDCLDALNPNIDVDAVVQLADCLDEFAAFNDDLRAVNGHGEDAQDVVGRMAGAMRALGSKGGGSKGHGGGDTSRIADNSGRTPAPLV